MAVLGKPKARAFRVTLRRGLAIAAMLTAPAVAQTIAGRRLHPKDATLALALTPLVMVVSRSGIGESASAELTGLLWPGLAGLAGLLLLLPQPAFDAWRPWAALVCLPLLTGLGAVVSRLGAPETAGETTRHLRMQAMIAGLVIAGMTYVCFAWHAMSTDVGWRGTVEASGLDGLTALLLLGALWRVGDVSWSTQFLLIPLMVGLEGAVLLHVVPDLRAWVGLGLLASGAVRQFFAGVNAPEIVTGMGLKPRVPLG